MHGLVLFHTSMRDIALVCSLSNIPLTLLTLLTLLFHEQRTILASNVQLSHLVRQQSHSNPSNQKLRQNGHPAAPQERPLHFVLRSICEEGQPSDVLSLERVHTEECDSELTLTPTIRHRTPVPRVFPWRFYKVCHSC